MKGSTSWELFCSRELALWLGAREPVSIAQHKELRDSGNCILVRERVALLPMFWPLLVSTREPSS